MAELDVTREAEHLATGRPMGWVATFGLTARAVVYLLMGWLAVLVAIGEKTDVDQRGVLTEIASRTLGSLVVLGLAVGFVSYAVWRFSEVFFGLTGEPDGLLGRASSLARAFTYAVLASIAVSVLAGSRHSQSEDQEQMAASVMAVSGGRLLVGAFGAAFMGVGAYMAYQGVTRSFLQSFPDVTGGRRTVVATLGAVGSTARGIVFAVTGMLVVLAAWQVDPEQAGGVDDGVGWLLGIPFGPWIIGALGIGLILFGIFGLAEARWRELPHEDRSRREDPTP
jgi:hypothetical protein